MVVKSVGRNNEGCYRTLLAQCNLRIPTSMYYISEQRGWGHRTYIEYSLCLLSARICVFLRHCDYFFGELLGFFRFGPCCHYRFVCEEGGYEVAEESLSVG